jgi:hypothetical protein
MPSQDDDLLARLNALKPSSVSLGSAAKSPVATAPSAPTTVEDKLADRLKSLRAGSGAASRDVPSASAHLDKADALRALVQDEIAADSDPIRDWQQQDPDEQALEDLLADIGADDQWKLDPEDPKHIASLLKEAKDSLPQETEAVGQEADSSEDWQHVDHPEPETKAATKCGQGKSNDAQDEADADNYVQRVLAELEIEKKYGVPQEDHLESQMPSESKAHTADLELPSTPADLRDTSCTAEPPTYEDSELEARFSKLGLDLPSTPNAPPSAKPKVTASIAGSKATSKLPTYTDEDIDSWCCICNEDGEVRCLGCDGDIYCHGCWQEGHGNGPGQERGHRAIQYSKKSGGGLAAA